MLKKRAAETEMRLPPTPWCVTGKNLSKYILYMNEKKLIFPLPPFSYFVVNEQYDWQDGIPCKTYLGGAEGNKMIIYLRLKGH